MDNSDNENEAEQFDSSRMHQCNGSLFIDKLVSGTPPSADIRAQFLGATSDKASEIASRECMYVNELLSISKGKPRHERERTDTERFNTHYT